MRPLRTSIAALAVFLAGCGASTGGSASGGLGDGVSEATAGYALLDLASGNITWRTQVADLATNPAYTDQIMVFRRVGSGAAQTLIAVFELTQAQWQRLDASTPWTAVPTAVVPATSHGAARPAYNLDYDTLVAVTAAYAPSGPGRLTLPSAAQWELAAGPASGWTWGPTATAAQLQSSAVVHETLNGVDGPRVVGGRSANANGVYDIHGNVWEWTKGGTEVRGGSWFNDHYASRIEVRSSTFQGVDSVLEHALIGARLVLNP
jgi:hypothetical protein